MSRAPRIALLGLAALSLATAPLAAAADQLTIPRARDRAAEFADRTCSHDTSCARAGVQSCRRQTARIVICRIFDHRKTDVQGSFLCTRLVRLALDPRTNRVPVTGVSGWEC